MSAQKIMSYRDAIKGALLQEMRRDKSVIVMGIGVDDHKAVFGSTLGLLQEFGPQRIFDTPLSEGAMTGVAIGAAIAGLKPVHIHIRNDFLYLCMDQLFNMAAKWRGMFGGQMNVPLVVRAVVGRSWGQGAQHSQSLQSMFMHVPGIKVLMPTTANDAQGLMLSAIRDPNPVVMIEHRLLYDISDRVPQPFKPTPIGKTIVRRAGKHATVVANSYMAVEALKAAEFLAQQGIEIEVLDPVTLVPLDSETIVNSVRKTGRVLVADSSWVTCGVSAEIAAMLAEKAFDKLRAPIRRVGMKPVTCPVSKPLEKEFYPNAETVAREVYTLLGRAFPKNAKVGALVSNFKGPF